MLSVALALALAALAALASVRAHDAAPVNIGVVETAPQSAWRTAAAAEAALGAAGAVQVAGVPPGEPLALGDHVCAAAARGAAAVLGGGGARLAAAAAARAGLPLLLPLAAPPLPAADALAMFPHPDVLAQVCAELCREKGWQSAVLLHAGGAAGAASVAGAAGAGPEPAALALLARQLPPPADGAQLRNLLLVLKKAGKTNFIVWCEAECAHRVLDAAQRVGLLAERHAYIVLALDLHTLDLDRFSHGGANVTGVRLFDPEAAAVRADTAAWRAAYERRLAGAAAAGAADAAADAARVQAAPPVALLLTLQAARLVRSALEQLRLPPGRAADCERGRAAFHADTLLNYLRSKEWREEEAGGPISWDADGGRRALQLEVVELRRGGRLVHAGVWAAHAGLAWQRQDPPAPASPPDSMTNRTFNVLIAVSPPYVMIRQSPDRLTGNDRYEGFCIELIQRLAEILHFNYTFVEQADGQYGSYNNETGQWSGMLGRLMSDEENMHFAITDLTITAERERAVDFTTPFMNLGISILFHKPTPPEPELFAFLLPFSRGVWLCLGLAYVGTSLVLYVVGRLCPDEWQNPYPCIEEPLALENQFTLANALWFNLGAVLLQGSEIAPVAHGTRAVASVWWLFALVITSSYTANLATLLAKKNTNEVIKNVEELAHNDLGIEYGAKKGGSTYVFFEQSTSKLYKEMFEQMRHKPQPPTNPDGIARVTNSSNYAFLMESTTIEYEMERNCEVIKVGGLLDSKGYGIAMRKNSTFRQALNVVLLQLQEAGTLRDMKTDWWHERNGGGFCTEEEERGGEELEMSNFRGLFLVLAVGCALGLALSALDLAAGVARRARGAGERFERRLAHELRFVFCFDKSVKPIHGGLSASSSGTETAERESLAEAEAEAEAEGEAEAEAAEAAAEDGTEATAAEGGARRRAGSLASARRRRCSIHAASVRLARHAATDSLTPSHRR